MTTSTYSTLIAEIGSATTRLSLIDLVDDEWRVVAHTEGPTTRHEPVDGVARGIVDLATELMALTGNELVRDRTLFGVRDGGPIRHLAITTSAAGPLPIAIVALGTNQSAHAAFQATLGIPSVVAQTLALGDSATTAERGLVQSLNVLLRGHPAVLLLAGGTEGGSIAGVRRLSGIASLIAHTLQPIPRIIYAGNSEGDALLRATVGDDVAVETVENLRPAPLTYRLEPVRAALRRVYTQLQIPQLSGYATLKQWAAPVIGSVVEDQRTMVRYLAERYERNILHLDIGAIHALAQVQAGGLFGEAILSGHGIATSAINILEAVGYDQIAAWMPIALPASQLHQRLLNRSLHGWATPADAVDLWIDMALNHVTVTRLIAVLEETRPPFNYDLLLGAGALAQAARPGHTVLTLLNSLALEQQQSRVAIELYLDKLSMLAACGALAQIDVHAASSVIEHDGLNNGPLATVIIPRGLGTPGTKALDVELRSSGAALQTQRVDVGEIVRLPLPQGQRGTLTLRPASGVAIGDNRPGAEVATDEAAIGGSLLGIVIDARPRPLELPADPAVRRETLQRWLRALDGWDDDLDYVVEVTPEETPEEQPTEETEAPDINESADEEPALFGATEALDTIELGDTEAAPAGTTAEPDVIESVDAEAAPIDATSEIPVGEPTADLAETITLTPEYDAEPVSDPIEAGPPESEALDTAALPPTEPSSVAEQTEPATIDALNWPQLLDEADRREPDESPPEAQPVAEDGAEVAMETQPLDVDQTVTTDAEAPAPETSLTSAVDEPGNPPKRRRRFFGRR